MAGVPIVLVANKQDKEVRIGEWTADVDANVCCVWWQGALSLTRVAEVFDFESSVEREHHVAQASALTG